MLADEFQKMAEFTTCEWDGPMSHGFFHINNYLSNQWISQCFDTQRWCGDDEGYLGYTEHVAAVDFSV